MYLWATELTRAFSLSSSLFLAVPFSEELLYFSIFSSSIFKNDIMLFIWYLVTWLWLSGKIKLKLNWNINKLQDISSVLTCFLSLKFSSRNRLIVITCSSVKVWYSIFVDCSVWSRFCTSCSFTWSSTQSFSTLSILWRSHCYLDKMWPNESITIQQVLHINNKYNKSLTLLFYQSQTMAIVSA